MVVGGRKVLTLTTNSTVVLSGCGIVNHADLRGRALAGLQLEATVLAAVYKMTRTSIQHCSEALPKLKAILCTGMQPLNLLIYCVKLWKEVV